MEIVKIGALLEFYFTLHFLFPSPQQKLDAIHPPKKLLEKKNMQVQTKINIKLWLYDR